MNTLPTIKHTTGTTTYYHGFNVTPENTNAIKYKEYFGLKSGSLQKPIILKIKNKEFDATIRCAQQDNSKLGKSFKRSSKIYPERDTIQIQYPLKSQARTLEAIKKLGNYRFKQILEITHVENNIFVIENITDARDYEEKNMPVERKKGFFKTKTIYKPSNTERKGSVNQRVGQNYFRGKLLERWEGRCAVTNISVLEVLIGSHIVPWRESSKDRLNPGNGILLSRNLDGLFDRYLITFNDEGKILISKKISKSDLKALGINKNMSLRFVEKDMLPFLRKHREIFTKEEKKGF